MVELFWDKDAGGFFTYGNDAEELIARMKDVQDGATPSANATAALALARLGELTGEVSFTGRGAPDHRNSMAPALSRVPAAFPGMALAAELPVFTQAAGGGRFFQPRRWSARLAALPARHRAGLGRAVPVAAVGGAGRAEAAGRAFVCEGYTCKLPVTAPTELAALLDQPRRHRARAGGGRAGGRRERSLVMRVDDHPDRRRDGMNVATIHPSAATSSHYCYWCATVLH